MNLHSGLILNRFLNSFGFLNMSMLTILNSIFQIWKHVTFVLCWQSKDFNDSRDTRERIQDFSKCVVIVLLRKWIRKCSRGLLKWPVDVSLPSPTPLTPDININKRAVKFTLIALPWRFTWDNTTFLLRHARRCVTVCVSVCVYACVCFQLQKTCQHLHTRPDKRVTGIVLQLRRLLSGLISAELYYATLGE